MNRTYQLVWNHALRVTQVVSELARAGGHRLGSQPARTALRRQPLAIALSLAMVSSPAWADCGPSDIPSCSAPGGAGVIQRTGSGGAGNGTGGGASQFDAGSGVTVPITGSAASPLGVGGTGAAGENAGGNGGTPGRADGGGITISGTTVGGAGSTGANGFNFASGGGGGGAGVVATGSFLTIQSGAGVNGGSGGVGGSGTSGDQSNGAGGGGGGAGAVVTANGSVLTVQGQAIGGSGGLGGSGGNNGGGGAGGDGVLVLGTSTSVSNTGVIIGGVSGRAGSGTFDSSAQGGTAGAGVNIVGVGSTLQNQGTVVGGTALAGGRGGLGIVTWGGVTITNLMGGVIAGGLNQDGSNNAAIQFHGTGNALVINAGSSIIGNLDLTANAQASISAASNNLALYNAVTLGTGATLTGDTTGVANLEVAGAVSGTGQVEVTGNHTLKLSGNNTYTGTTTIDSTATLALTGTGSIATSSNVSVGGTFDISSRSSTASIRAFSGAGQVLLGSTYLNVTNATGTFSGILSGAGGLTIAGGSQTLAGINTYTGQTTIANGATLALQGSGSVAGAAGVLVNTTGTFSIGGTTNGTSVRTLSGDGSVSLGAKTLTLTAGSGTFDGTITGSGALVKQGAGTFILTGNSTYGGGTTVTAGTLVIDGVLSGSGLAGVGSGATLLVGDSTHTTASLASDVQVNGGTLGGHGTVQGDVTLTNGATLAPGGTAQQGTLTVGGNLTVGAGSQLNFDFGAPGPNFSTPGQSDHVVVNGNLSIDAATLNINNLGSMGPGLYNLFQWSNALSITNGGFAPPTGMSLQVLTIDKQINLIDTQSNTLDVWNANGLAGPGSMGGGSGTWSITSSNWADTNGQYVGPMSPQPGFAIFGGASGTVTVDDSQGLVSATGMQFASDGYHLTGDAIDLVGQGGTTPVLRVSGGATAVIDNVLEGADGINKTDAGTLVLNGQNIYSGTTVLSGGELSVSADGNLGLAANSLDFEGGTLQVTGNAFHGTARQITWGNAGGGFDIADAGNTFAVSQALSGSGGLYKTGAGTLTLSGNNTYTGGTTIAAGTLAGTTSSLQGAVLNNGQLVFDQGTDGTFTGSVSGTGQLVKRGSGTVTLDQANTYTGGTLVAAGTLEGNTTNLQGNITADATLAFAQDADGIFNGTLAGTGHVMKNGKGALVLNGTNSFSGNTEVSAGKLVVGDDAHAAASLAGSVTVDSGATLGGIGTIGGLDLAGTLTPGNSIGTLNVNGNATIEKGSTYQFEVAPDGSSDRLAVTGNVTILGGSAVALASDGTWAPQTQLQIITAGGGITGQFSSITSSLAFLTPTLSYGANAVTLQLARNDIRFDDVAQTANQRAVAGAIEPLGMASPLYAAVVGLDAPTARKAYDAMSGEQFASTRSALLDDSRYVRDAIDRHLLGLSNDGAQATDAHGVTAWTSAWGHWGNNDGNSNAARLNADGSGLLVGADVGVGSDARLGAVAGHHQLSARVDDRGSNAHVTGTDLGLYGDVSFGAFALRGGVAYAWQQIDSRRNVSFGSFANRLGDRYDARVAQGFIEGGYRFQVGASQQIEPFLNVARVQLHTDASQESGGAAALAASGESDGVTLATLGVRDTWALDAAAGIHAHVGIGWQQAWGDTSPTSTLRFASGSDRFDIVGTPMGKHAGVIDGGLAFAITPRASVDASYVGRFGDGAKDQGARLSLNVRW